jgi:hypothetical protein
LNKDGRPRVDYELVAALKETTKQLALDIANNPKAPETLKEEVKIPKNNLRSIIPNALDGDHVIESKRQQTEESMRQKFLADVAKITPVAPRPQPVTLARRYQG